MFIDISLAIHYNERMKCNRNIPKQLRDRLIKDQDNACFYCNQVFGELVCYKKKFFVLKPNIDHIVPFLTCQCNADNNLVAACQVCNRIKWAYVFESVQALFAYIKRMWQENGEMTCNQVKRKVAFSVVEHLYQKELGKGSAQSSVVIAGIQTQERQLHVPTVESHFTPEQDLIELMTGIPMYDLSDAQVEELMIFGKLEKTKSVSYLEGLRKYSNKE